MPIQSLEALLESHPLAGRRVFVRADLNVPLSNGAIADDSRIRASLPTLKRLLGAGARVVLASHLGRPKGERKPELSLRVLVSALAEALSVPVHFVEDCVGPEAEAAAGELANGEVLLLENLRFHGAETKNDPEFAEALAKLADVYVNDAFGTAHPSPRLDRGHGEARGRSRRPACCSSVNSMRLPPPSTRNDPSCVFLAAPKCRTSSVCSKH